MPAPADLPYETWEGEAEALSAAAGAGRRAAAWVRSLPGPSASTPLSFWVAGGLPDAVEAVMGGLDPQDCDRMGPGGRPVGVPPVPTLWRWRAWPLSPGWSRRWTGCPWTSRSGLLVVASVVTGAVQLLTNDPGTAIRHGLLARQCAILDHAARPDGQLSRANET